MPIRLFESYSHENGVWSKRLAPLLKVKANVTEMRPWHDNELKAGDEWDDVIRAELKQMDIFLCLVSVQFLASRYIQEVELPEALRRQAAGEIVIVPLVLYPIDWEADCPKLKKFNPLPAFGKSWREYEKAGGDWNDAMFDIGRGLKQVIEKVRARKILDSAAGLVTAKGIASPPSSRRT
jgi:hypothetical protein